MLNQRMKLTSYEGDDTDFWRIQRLMRVEAFLNGDLSQGVKKIIHLHDHKGILKSYWLLRPTPQERQSVINAWDYECECGHEFHLLSPKWIKSNIENMVWEFLGDDFR